MDDKDDAYRQMAEGKTAARAANAERLTALAGMLQDLDMFHRVSLLAAGALYCAECPPPGYEMADPDRSLELLIEEIDAEAWEVRQDRRRLKAQLDA
jgi:hypothetical protein